MTEKKFNNRKQLISPCCGVEYTEAYYGKDEEKIKRQYLKPLQDDNWFCVACDEGFNTPQKMEDYLNKLWDEVDEIVSLIEEDFENVTVKKITKLK